MILLAVTLAGFCIARFTSKRWVFGVGGSLFTAISGFFVLFGRHEIPPFANKPSMFEAYISAAITGANGLLVIGFAAAILTMVIGAYVVGAIAGRVSLKWTEETH